jgi:RNA polymerase sigma-70 factor (ECF subfamily)
VADDDAVLVQQCLAGDQTSLRCLIDRYQAAVFGLCFRMLGQREDAEDVAQDSLLRAFRSLSRWDAERPFKPWILAIAANRCRTFLEKRSRQPYSANDMVVNTATAEVVESADVGEELQLALAKLREDYRMCFILFHVQELSCAEIGEILNCPQGTVKTWLHRARKELAGHLQRRGVVPGVEPEMR